MVSVRSASSVPPPVSPAPALICTLLRASVSCAPPSLLCASSLRSTYSRVASTCAGSISMETVAASRTRMMSRTSRSVAAPELMSGFSVSGVLPTANSVPSSIHSPTSRMYQPPSACGMNSSAVNRSGVAGSSTMSLIWARNRSFTSFVIVESGVTGLPPPSPTDICESLTVLPCVSASLTALRPAFVVTVRNCWLISPPVRWSKCAASGRRRPCSAKVPVPNP